MAYDTELADQVILAFEQLHPFAEKKMFGGMGLMINGHLCVGVIKTFLIVRVGKEAYQETLSEEGVFPFDFTGKPLTGWVYVDLSLSQQSLENWLHKGLDFVLSLPAKK